LVFIIKNQKNKVITWTQLVDEALCFGWIDGIRKKIDDESYCNRLHHDENEATGAI
jgi:hypothetical protein